MLVSTPPQVAPATAVDTGATAVRGFSTEVRSDVPPVQQGDGVKYTRGRPSDNDTYSNLYNPKKRTDPRALSSPSDQQAVTRDERDVARSATEQESADVENSEADNQNRTETDNPGADAVFTLSSEDQALVEQLKRRDREVRLHEQAHQSAGGQYTGSASYEYKRGPDGKNYAVGGEVSVDTSATDDPAATIQKARQIRAAALAPAQPSAQDRRVASKAERMIVVAEQEVRLAEEAAKAKLKEQNSKDEGKVENTTEEAESTAVGDDTTSSASLEGDVSKKTAASDNSVSVSSSVSSSAESSAEDSDADDSETSSSSGKQDKASARAALEKLLLGDQSLVQRANASGYVSPESPNGQSGLLNLVI